MGKIPEKTRDADRIKQYDYALAMLDAPNEGDDIIYMIEGDDTRYRGKIIKRVSSDKQTSFSIGSYTKPVRQGKVVMIEHKGIKFLFRKKKT